MKRNTIALLLSLILGLSMTGCTGIKNNQTESSFVNTVPSESITIESSVIETESSSRITLSSKSESILVSKSYEYSSEPSSKTEKPYENSVSRVDSVSKAQIEQSSSIKEVSKVDIPKEEVETVVAVDPASLPKYSGDPYTIVNGNTPAFPSVTNKSFEYYSDFDHLGRCGAAAACIGTDLMPTEPRGSIGMIKPSGWHTIRYDIVDGKYLYNRCHLIGYQLTAENANEKNLITGTRYLNVEGMLPFENMVADYIKETNHHVMYRSTPIFEGSNLLASGVQIEAYSVEDDGKGICFNVYCYNVQPGVNINYSDGSSSLGTLTETSRQNSQAESSVFAESSIYSEPPIVSEVSKEPVSQTSIEPVSQKRNNSKTYILNTNTKKFHNPGCSSINQMKESNKREYSGTRDELISMGYDPCKRCNP